MAYKPVFFMGYTPKGQLKHLTSHSQSLCGQWTLTRIVKNNLTGMPVPYRDHWQGEEICHRCMTELDSILRPLVHEKPQKRLV